MSAASSGRRPATSTDWLTNATIGSGAVACGAKRCQAPSPETSGHGRFAPRRRRPHPTTSAVAAHIFVLRADAKDPVEDERRKPRRQIWISARGAEQTVAGRERAPRSDAQPSLKLALERGVGHRRGIAGDNQIRHLLDLPPLGEQNEIDTGHRGRVGHEFQVGNRDRPAVVFGAGRLTPRGASANAEGVAGPTANSNRTEPSFAGLKRRVPGRPDATAATAAPVRFSAAQPRLTNRGWSSGSTMAVRRE